jgi:hypothetical protein
MKHMKLSNIAFHYNELFEQISTLNIIKNHGIIPSFDITKGNKNISYLFYQIIRKEA